MTTLTPRSLAASSAPTPTFEEVIGVGDVRTAVESGAPRAQVFYFESYTREIEAMPDRHTSIDALAQRWATDPGRSASLGRARGWLADVTQAAAGDTIRSLRLRKGSSQAQLAVSIGTSQPHIARIERGTENVTIDTCRRLAAALGVDLNTLDAALRRQEALHAPRSKT